MHFCIEMHSECFVKIIRIPLSFIQQINPLFVYLFVYLFAYLCVGLFDCLFDFQLPCLKINCLFVRQLAFSICLFVWSFIYLYTSSPVCVQVCLSKCFWSVRFKKLLSVSSFASVFIFRYSFLGVQETFLGFRFSSYLNSKTFIS